MAVDLETIRATFRLEGEDVIRLSTGKVVQPPKQWPPSVFIKWLGNRQQVTASYHRIKFALAHGWLPDFVDHRDVDFSNHLLDNLRAATRSQNQSNRRPVPRKEALPRGVYRMKDGRFYAKINYRKRQTYLGQFDTPEDASAAVEKILKELHGEFYRDPTGGKHQ